MSVLAIIFLAVSAPSQVTPQVPPPDLDKIEAALKSNPDDPMLHYRKCQALFARGKEQEAMNHAAVALAKFKVARNDLASIMLGSIKSGKYKIDVHYNMGPGERAEKKDGIVRPYSFRVWTTDAKPKLIRTLDYELGYFNGMLFTAAVGESSEGAHANLGILDPKGDFAAVKKKVLEIVAR